MAMVECPSISETILGLTFWDSRSMAHVCLKSWKRIGGRPARLSGALREWLRRFEGADALARRRCRSCQEAGLHLEQTIGGPYVRWAGGPFSRRAPAWIGGHPPPGP